MEINIKEQDIKMKVTSKQSKQVQEICFGLGGGWGDSLEKALEGIADPFLYLIDLRLFRGYDIHSFLESEFLEVSAEEFIKTKGFTACSICGESKQDCPREESCSYKIKDTKEESLTESQIEDLEQLGIDKVGLRKEVKEETKQEDIPKNNVKEYGFEADFEGEILKEVKDCYIGWVSYADTIFSCKWNKKGKGITRLSDIYFNLNPIKILKKQTLLIKEDEEYHLGFKSKLVGNSGQDLNNYLNQGWKIASLDFVLSLLGEEGDEND